MEMKAKVPVLFTVTLTRREKKMTNNPNHQVKMNTMNTGRWKTIRVWNVTQTRSVNRTPITNKTNANNTHTETANNKKLQKLQNKQSQDKHNKKYMTTQTSSTTRNNGIVEERKAGRKPHHT